MKINDYILIDFENLNSSSEIKNCQNDRFNILLFLGPQKKFDVEIIKSFSGKKIEIYRIEHPGKNSLDFYMVYQVGRIIERDKFSKIFIISMDKNYDPLVKNLVNDGVFIKRFDSVDKLNMYLNIDPINLLESSASKIEEYIKINNKKFIGRSNLKEFINSTFQEILTEPEIFTIINILENRIKYDDLYETIVNNKIQIKNEKLKNESKMTSNNLIDSNKNKSKNDLSRFINHIKKDNVSKPKKLKTLFNALKNWFGNSTTESQIEEYVKTMVRLGIIVINNDKIKYKF